MNPTLRLFLFAGIMLYFVFLFYFIKKQNLFLKYIMLWILFGIIMLLIALFPQALIFLTRMMGIVDWTNAFFSIIFFCMIMIIMSLTAIVSALNQKVKKLTQINAIMEKRIRDLEVRVGSNTNPAMLRRHGT